MVLMNNKNLDDYIESGSLSEQVFVSDYPISANGMPKHYKIDVIRGNYLYVFPVDYIEGKAIAREKSVGVLYRQHKDDLAEEI